MWNVVGRIQAMKNPILNPAYAEAYGSKKNIWMLDGCEGVPVFCVWMNPIQFIPITTENIRNAFLFVCLAQANELILNRDK